MKHAGIHRNQLSRAAVQRRLKAAVAFVVAAVVWASVVGGFVTAREGEARDDQDRGSRLESLAAEDSSAVVAAQYTPHQITLDSEGKFSKLVKIESILPEGVIATGDEIDVSGFVVNANKAPILQGNPQRIMFLSLAHQSNR